MGQETTTRLVTVAEAATLLAVSERTIRRWIDSGRIPHLRLPSGEHRVPQGALLASLGGSYALGDELEEIDARTDGVTEDSVRAASE